MIRTYLIRSVLCIAVLAAGRAEAQDGAPSEGRRFNFGVRLQGFPLKLFETKVVSTSTTKPIADYKYTGTTDSSKVGVAPSIEFRLTHHLSVGTEFLYHRVQYKEAVEIRSGKKDPNASTDDRPVATQTQTTHATYWEAPVLARYYGLRSRGTLSKFYFVGGLGYRYIGTIQTGNEIQNADKTTDYNEIPAKADRKNQFGAVAGIGMRFIDALGVRVSPEIRYTRWQGTTLHGVSYSSTQNEARVGLGLSF